MGAEPVEETPTEVGENRVELSSPPRELIISPLLEPVFQTPQATQSSPGWKTRFFEHFMMRASPPTGTWLCCSDHPFFADLPNIPKEQIVFFNRAFTREGDIF